MKTWYRTIPSRNLEIEKLKVNKKVRWDLGRDFFLEQKGYIIYKCLWQEADTKYNKVGR